MPKLDDPLKEHFAQLIARGDLKKKDAYAQARMAAGDDTPLASITASTNASRLLKDPDVQARVNELIKDVTKNLDPIERGKLRDLVENNPGIMRAAVLTREWVIDELIDNAKRAKAGKNPNFNASNRALELLGRNIGLFAEQIDTEKGKYVLRDRPLTADEWINKHADRSN